MTLKNFYQAPIKGYQYISKMLPASCRYYPSCSEYASWQFEFNTPHKAFSSTSLRILRCNQFFKGGIDYPLVDFSLKKTSCILTFNAECGKININYWFVPKNTTIRNTEYYIVKDFDAIKRST
ncbi:MAG: membrane protein insertion efficiency factor YidD [Sulfurovum sp.]|nr:membrane protein insertion efficiency factor YidD [Sulfurovum sp.]